MAAKNAKMFPGEGGVEVRGMSSSYEDIHINLEPLKRNPSGDVTEYQVPLGFSGNIDVKIKASLSPTKSSKSRSPFRRKVKKMSKRKRAKNSQSNLQAGITNSDLLD